MLQNFGLLFFKDLEGKKRSSEKINLISDLITDETRTGLYRLTGV